MFDEILDNVREKAPLVHNITNYVTVNDCANIILACGGSPVMADNEFEVEDITSISASLVINIGTISDTVVSAMIKAGQKANELNRPVVLDPVGIGASKLRTEAVHQLLEKVKFSVIRGNISEIKTLYVGSGFTNGVDATEQDKVTDENMGEVIQFAQQLSEKTGAIIVITGATDLVVDNHSAFVIHNGHKMMSRITGSGCMLSSLIGAFCGANPATLLESTSAAVCAMGLCGELAYEKVVRNDSGTSSFRNDLIDYMSKMDTSMLKAGMKIERR